MRKKILLAGGIVLLTWGSFAFGVVSRLHLEHVAPIDERLQNLHPGGDAPPEIRMEVLATLRSFQDGYIRREPKELNSFMRNLFPEDGDILLMGTDPDEWVRGSQQVSTFIRQDWDKWGDFRFAVNDSIVWSSGDMAWAVSTGTVRDGGFERRVRFSATLKRGADRFRFRQLQFQWDDAGAHISDLLRPKIHVRLARQLSGYIRDILRYRFR